MYALQPQNNIFDEVRQGFETVARLAQHVTIRHDRLDAYAKSLPSQSPDNVFDSSHHYAGDEEGTAAYVLMLDSINFGSGYVPHLKTEGWQLLDRSVYFTISTHLKTLFEDAVPDAKWLSHATPEDCARFLKLDPQKPYSKEFLDICAGSLQELGAAIIESYEGSFLKFVEAAEGSAEAFVRQLIQMHYFNDIHSYKDMTIPFYKRAQITAADMHLACGQKGQILFYDIGHLTMFPDNAVPHVLRTDGLLEYKDELAERIRSGDEIPSGSEEEIEMRACAGQVVELIARKKDMIAMDVDHILWHRSVENPCYSESAAHRTLSGFY